uniref:Uncharacterized protein n=1 Tax=viral metagenome TaxID=1070528 RepID=A0A6C0BBH8_9ZZZZ
MSLDHEENLFKTKHLPILRTAPIYLVSSHGEYRIDREPSFFTVPPDTYIFETVDAGEYCITNIDEPLWNILQGVNRKPFIEYFLGEKNNAVESFAEIFANLHFYKPGDKYYNRTLTFAKHQYPTREKKMGLSHLGFYKFPIGKGVVTNLGNVSAEVPLLKYNKTPIMAFLGMKTGSEWNSVDTEWVINNIKERPAIFVFSSCGYVNCKIPDKKQCIPLMEKIRSQQSKQDLYLRSIGINSRDGISAYNEPASRGISYFPPESNERGYSENSNEDGEIQELAEQEAEEEERAEKAKRAKKEASCFYRLGKLFCRRGGGRYKQTRKQKNKKQRKTRKHRIVMN